MATNWDNEEIGNAPDEYDGSLVPQDHDLADLGLIKQALRDQSRRRRQSTTENFEIRVDGVSRGALGREQNDIEISLPLEADVIQIFASDPTGEVLIATHILCHSGDGNFVPTGGVVQLAKREFVFEVSVLRGPLALFRRVSAVCQVKHRLVEEEKAAFASGQDIPWSVSPQRHRTALAPLLARIKIAFSDLRNGVGSSLESRFLSYEPAFAGSQEAVSAKKGHPLASWRRRIAAMRVFHVLALGSTAIGSILSLTGSVRGTGSLRGGNMGAALLLLATMTIIGIRLWWLSRFCDRAPVIPPSPAQEEIARRLRSLAGMSALPVLFHLLPASDHAPARVAKTRRGLHIFLNPGRLQTLSASQSDALTSGIVWHEIGHYLQWDTTLGRWSLRASRLMGWLSLVVGFCSTLFVIFSIAMFLRSAKPAALPVEMVGALLVTVLATAGMFAVFLGVRFWCRFSEYNSDHTAVIAGYGPEIAKLLKSSRSPRISSLVGFHPSNASRVDRIEHLLAAIPAVQGELGDHEPLAVPSSLRIRLADYLYGGLLYVAPIFFGFELGTRILLLLAHHWIH